MLPARFACLLVVAALAAPAVSAHTTVYSTDGKVRASVGQLNEPVVTYAKTGLDLCFTQNTTAREPVTINPGAFVATLRSPSGKTLTMPMTGQFGRAGCYQFEKPYVLTEPGQYLVDLSGTDTFTFSQKNVKAGNAVQDQGNLTFPSAAPDLRQLQAENAALAQRVAALESKAKTESKGASFAGLLILPALFAAVLLRRRTQT